MAKRSRIFILKEDRQIYEQLRKLSAFKDASDSDLFMIALMLGLRQGNPKRKKASDSFIRDETFPRRYDALVKAIAVSKEGVSVLADIDRVYTIAEEYANAGIQILKQMSSQGSDRLLAELEQVLIEELQGQSEVGSAS